MSGNKRVRPVLEDSSTSYRTACRIINNDVLSWMKVVNNPENVCVGVEETSKMDISSASVSHSSVTDETLPHPLHCSDEYLFDEIEISDSSLLCSEPTLIEDHLHSECDSDIFHSAQTFSSLELHCEDGRIRSEIDDIFLDALDFTNLEFDCDICLDCSCLACDVCVHSPSGKCAHCDKCLEGALSENCCEEGDLSENDGGEDAFSEINSKEEGEDLTDSDKIILSDAELKNSVIKQDLIDIALKHNMSHEVLNDILGFLRKYNVGKLPKTARTLMSTPLSTKLRQVKPGEYWHNGLEKHFHTYLNINPQCSSVKIFFSVDGLPLAQSSSSSFWPITCSFNDLSEVFLIGAYHGHDKPEDSNEFLKDFIDEVIPLCENGFECKGRIIKVSLFCAVCDAPAKSFILKTVSHNAYFACPRCSVEGEYLDRRMAYVDVDAPLRTDEGFANQEQGEHHSRKSLLEKVPRFGLVSCVPFDWLHLVLLGVMRKMIYVWLKGQPKSVKLRASAISQLSDKLVSLSQWVPRDFVRRPRSLQYIKRFKGTEFRQILLYTGPVLFKDILGRKLYQHFLVLHVSVTILVNSTHCSKYLDYALVLLKYFVQVFSKLYGPQYISHNVHSLVHLTDDVASFGTLETFGSFRFENFYQFLKKIVRKGEKPLVQLARRYGEVERGSTAKHGSKLPSANKCVMSHPYFSGCLPEDCRNPQYQMCQLPGGVRIDLSKANNCCALTNGSVVLVENFACAMSSDEIMIIGREFVLKENLYTKPCPSSLFGIYAVSKLSELKTWPADSIHQKCYRMPFHSGFAVVPIHHTEQQ